MVDRTLYSVDELDFNVDDGVARRRSERQPRGGSWGRNPQLGGDGRIRTGDNSIMSRVL